MLLTLAVDGGEWSSSCPGHFTPRERTHRTHWNWGWVGPRVPAGDQTPVIQPI